MIKKTFITPKNIIAEESILLDDGRIIYLTHHAKQRLEQRNIPRDYIKQTFTNPDIIMPNKDFENAKNYEKNINGIVLKIGIKCEDEPLVLITAFIK